MSKPVGRRVNLMMDDRSIRASSYFFWAIVGVPFDRDAPCFDRRTVWRRVWRALDRLNAVWFGGAGGGAGSGLDIAIADVRCQETAAHYVLLDAVKARGLLAPTPL